MDEVDLLRRIATHEPKAYEDFYRHYEKRVYWYALTLVKQRESAEDVVIEVMMAVWAGAASRFQGTAKVSTWLLQMARHKAIDHLRKSSKDSTREGEEVLATFPASERPLDEALDRRRIIQRCFDALSLIHREVLLLANEEGLPYQEVADIAGCPLGTVKTRVSNGKKRLQECLERHGLSHAFREEV